MFDFLKKIFGTKADRDYKELLPILKKIQNAYETIKNLSNDELRAKTDEFRAIIWRETEKEELRMSELRKQLDKEYDMKPEAKQAVYKEIEFLEKKVNEITKKVLNDILPEAFAVVKETARRFKDNETIVVNATAFDRHLATIRDFVTIDGTKAIFSNQWKAGGNMVQWDMCHYDAQLIGGIVLHQGKIAEMATGEGKTLVATLPVYLNALPGKGVHVITVNDYLAKRDSEWMGPIYEFHGLSVDCIDKYEPHSEERRLAYMSDITYGTNNEFGFDYLRDNMARNESELVQRSIWQKTIIRRSNNNTGLQREIISPSLLEQEVTSMLDHNDLMRSLPVLSAPALPTNVPANVPTDTQITTPSENISMELIRHRAHNFAIVDEVDSVLIDDARTPLIISGPTPKGDQQAFDQYKPIVEKLYNAQKTYVSVILTKAKKMLAENPDPAPQEESAQLLLRAHRGLPKNPALIRFLSEPGMKQLLQRTESFYMQDQNRNMHIIDDELYFVIEEKLNSVDIMDKGIDLISRDADEAKLFIMPDVGAQIADLEKENLSPDEKSARKEEIYNNFAVASDRIHTIHQLLKAYTMFSLNDEYVIIDGKVKIVDEQTGRIMEGRRYSDGLHQAIEAKENVKVEAATQTYATITLQNYFRMYSKLSGMTGTAITEAGEFWKIYKLDVVEIRPNKPIIRIDANDLVYKTKEEKIEAVVDEIIRLHEIGRPVLVGTTSVENSEHLSNILTKRRIEHNVLNAKLHKREADIVAEAGHLGTVTIATNMAGRGTDIKLTPEVREIGGLAIIGTERHESRRVDRQLRGRAGRQGDPGSSQFFVSLEDDLMRLFGSDRIAKVMDRMGHQRGEVIQHRMITNSIERAQQKVEENNFGIRKRLLDYDDVMNEQRSSIYRKRHNALFGDLLSIDISQMFRDVCEIIVSDAWESKDFEQFKKDMIMTFGCESPFEEQYFMQERPEVLVNDLYEVVYAHYNLKLKRLCEIAYPQIELVYLEHGDKFKNIAIPFTDGKKTINIVAPLKKCYETEGREVGLSFEKGITLHVIDNAWKEHLRVMDELKNNVQNASYEQKDPLLIYKLEAYHLFEQLLVRISEEIVTFLNLGKIPVAKTELKEARLPESDAKKLQTGRQEVGQGRQLAPGRPSNEPIRAEKKIGRNDPCPCGSGKKYKNCHGRLDASI